MEEFARWRNGVYVMQAVNACFGGEYPENPLGLVGKSPADAEDTENAENLTQEEIERAREALVLQLSIMEGRNRREKARKERQRLQEQKEQESDSE